MEPLYVCARAACLEATIMIAKISNVCPVDEDVGADALSERVKAFLWAEVGVEGNGMALSVLSLLSRQTIDPWEEASLLASLPRQAATQRLAQRMIGMPGGMWSDEQAVAVASRLIPLLPAHATAGARMRAMRMKRRETVLGRLSDTLLPRPEDARQPKLARMDRLLHLYLALALLVTVLAGLSLHAVKNPPASLTHDRTGAVSTSTHGAATAASPFKLR